MDSTEQLLHFWRRRLWIGPPARLNRWFLPLLYDRRHLGVMMFTLALGHGVTADPLEPAVSE